MADNNNVGLKIVAAAIAVLAIIGLFVYSTNSALIGLQEETKKVNGDLDAELQRQHDLIPNMVSVAESSLKFQQELATGYAEAREGLVDLKAANETYQEALKTGDTEKAMRAFATAKNSWGEIDIRAESVPQADTKQLTELNNEMSALQNTITYQRQKYNAVVKDYNVIVRTPPRSWIASALGYKIMEPFKAEEDAEKVPEIKLNF